MTLSLLLLAPTAVAWQHPGFVSVKTVYDGDTILLENGEKVRYLGIDAPEIDHDGGRSGYLAYAARDLNQAAIGGNKVRLVPDREARDRHGRLLAYVFLEDGTMLNALLVRRGLAHVLRKMPNDRYWDLLLGKQREAMREKVGIWGRHEAQTEKEYLGNRHSLLFHRPGCPFGEKTRPEHALRFRTRLEAFWEGYAPCRRCTP